MSTNAAKWISRFGTIKFYCIVLYCIVLYCIVLYCIVLYCIVHMKTCIGGAVPIMTQYDMCQMVQKWFLVCWDSLADKTILRKQTFWNLTRLFLTKGSWYIPNFLCRALKLLLLTLLCCEELVFLHEPPSKSNARNILEQALDMTSPWILYFMDD